MNYVRSPIEIESPEEIGYDKIKFNLTESSISDQKVGDLLSGLDDLVFSYGDHRGDLKLRKLIAEMSDVEPQDVLLTTGGAMGIFIVLTSLLKKADKFVVVRPNYATNIETARTIGAQIDFLELNFEENFRLKLEKVEEKLVEGKTKILSVTSPNNPTGVGFDRSELENLISIGEKHSVLIFLDETYREMNFNGKIPVGASLSKNVVSLGSISKSFGFPGIRIGWLICRDEILMNKFFAAKEQIIICGSTIDEQIAFRVLSTREQRLTKILEEIRIRFNLVKNWIEKSKDFFEWVEPNGAVVCFPRLKAKIDPKRFYQVLNEKFQTFVGPGHWFEMDPTFMRIGYGWPETREQLIEALDNLNAAVQFCLDEQK